MSRFILFVLVVVFVVAGAFGQCDSLRMRLLGTWECPTDDMAGDNSGCIGKIGDYVILAQKTNAYANCDSLWIIDVSDPTSPYLATVYTDTAFSDTFSSIRWFTYKEVNDDSGYIYVGYVSAGGYGREYFRVLKLTAGNPPTITRMGIVDSILYTEWGVMLDDWVYAGNGFRVNDPSSPIEVSPTLVVEGYVLPPDGSSSGYGFCDRASSDNYIGTALYVESIEPEEEPAEAIILCKVTHIEADVCTSYVRGCWRGSYEGHTGYSIAINESLGVVALGTDYGVVFVSMDDIEDSIYNAEPIATWYCDHPVSDLVWIDGYVYIAEYGLYVIDVTDLDGAGPDTLANYNLWGLIGHSSVEIAVDGNYIYTRSGRGNLYILELDTTMGVQNGCSFLDEKFRIFPNPILQNQKLVLDKKLKTPRLFDISGREMKLENRTINTSELSPGIYLLVANLNNKKIVKKLVVLK